MSFASLEFATFAAVAVLLYNLVRHPALRFWMTVLLNAVFVATFVSLPEQIVPLIGFVALGYGAIALAPRVGAIGFGVLLAAVIVAFVWLKKYAFAGFLPNFITFPYATVGLSYILFRVLHLMIDVRQGVMKAPSVTNYLAYVLFFLSFVSGPIQRYDEFGPQMIAPTLPVTFETANRAFQRIVTGLFLIAVVTQITNYGVQHLEPRFTAGVLADSWGVRTYAFYAIIVAIYTVHLYLNFSGYMEMVIGVGMLCGFTLPENFNRPYLSTNFLDFWSRWHMTLSNWFKLYLFNPLLKWLTEKYGTPKVMPYLSSAAFFVTFGVMGVWHGSTWAFVVYGLWLGLGASLNKLYQVQFVKSYGKKSYRELTQKGWYRRLSRALTLAYFMIALTALWLPSELETHVATIKVLPMLGAVFVALTCGIIVLDVILGIAVPLLQKLAPAAETAKVETWRAPVLTGLKLCAVVILIMIVDAGGAPEFVYKAF